MFFCYIKIFYGNFGVISFMILPKSFFFIRPPKAKPLYMKMFSYRKETSEETDTDTDCKRNRSKIHEYGFHGYVRNVIIQE